MTGWNDTELRAIGEATELEITSRREDGTLRPFVTIWGVHVGDDLYIRSAHGADNPWFRRATASGTGRVRAGGVERDVTFQKPDPGAHSGIDAAYHTKYDRYGPRIVGSVVGDHAVEATLRLAPQH
ncbi:MAG: hypothetical protein QOI10_4356 [Solirubrobacterales bacterium]|jgi:hypothetical protein|nr:hypothetical protein [Solirubrobacterales bacterium]